MVIQYRGRLGEILSMYVCRYLGEDGEESLVTGQEDMGTNGNTGNSI